MGGGTSHKIEQSQIALSDQQAKNAAQYSQFAKQSLDEMNALYAPVVSYNQGVVKAANSGDYSQLVQASGPALGSISQQFSQAKQGILNQVPGGAGRDAVLANLPAQQADATARTLNQTYQGALGGLTQLGASYAGVGLQGAGASISSSQAAQSGYGNVQQQKAQGKADTLGFIGGLAGAAGSAVGGGFGAGGAFGCWIAEAIYGVDDVRTHMVREYLNGPFCEHAVGRFVMHVYVAIGRQVAWAVRRSSLLRWMLRPLFDLALNKALAGA